MLGILGVLGMLGMLGILGMLGLLGMLGGAMKIKSDIQKIVDSKLDKCADDAEIAALEDWNALDVSSQYAYDFWCNGYFRDARCAWDAEE